MTFAKLDTKSKTDLLRQLAAAIRNNDYDEFCETTQYGLARFNEQMVATLINEHLPLVLDVKYIPRLLKFTAGSAYIETVRSLLAEMTQVLATEGFTIGKDFSYGEDDGTPYLRMSQATALKVENIYVPYAWKQCLPYLVID
jgi:hypothetical protein